LGALHGRTCALCVQPSQAQGRTMKQLYNDLRACWEAFRYTWHHRRYRRQQRDQIQLPF
jgi:hypothetical protein